MSKAAVTAAALVLAAVSVAPAVGQSAGSQADRRAEQERRLQEELAAPRPIDAVASVWIDELTWMEVRDAIAAGAKTAIIPTGGIEQNGPYLITGKHNVILRGACEELAHALGNALCSPVIAFVPEGDIAQKTGHMRYPGTISVREETFRMLLDDVASSLQAHGFTEIILIGDSGGNQEGLEATANALNARWQGSGSVARYVPEFYQYDGMTKHMNEVLGVVEPENDGLHDSYWISAIMVIVDPASVRFDQRMKSGRTKINGVDLAPLEKTKDVGRKLSAWRTEQTVKAIRAARAGND